MITVRKMTDGDCLAVSEIEKECFSKPWSERALADGIARGDARYFVAQSESGETVGYIGSHAVLGEVGVTNVAVKCGFRRQGIGESLLRALMKECEVHGDELLTLEVRESNASAISFYEKLGFENVGIRKNFYSSPTEDALLYTYYFGDVI